MLRDIRAYFQAKHDIIPELKGFIFGADEQSLRERISKFATYYMFVDYGTLSSTRDSNNRINDSFELAVTIAMPVGTRLATPDEVEACQIDCFEIIAALRKTMLLDQRDTPWLKYLKDSHQILPFIAPDLCRSVGSTLAFSVEGYDLLDVKKV